MKKSIALFTALTLLTPTLAMAQPGPNAGPGQGTMRAEVKAQMHASSSASSTNNWQKPPKLGPAIHHLASTTRAEWKGMASTTRAAARAKVEAIHALIAQHKVAMHERAGEARMRAKANFGEKIEKHVGKISDRLASTSQHLAGLADRLDTRIEELADQGYDMSSSTALLAIAKNNIAAANVKITAVNTALAAAMASGTTTAKAEIPAVRTAVAAAEAALKLVKENLHATLRAVKVESSATSSASI